MLSNIKLIGVIFLSVLLLTNCKKECKQDTNYPGELVFTAIDMGTQKDGYDIQCNDQLVITHARVQLNGTFYYPLTFELDGKLYTQSIKLAPGAYTINEFSLMDDMGTPNFYDDDQIVKSTPMFDSEYAQYVSNPMDGDPDFTIVAFEKNEYAIDVLCFIPANYMEFGFEWFVITEITVREQCFFGDICIKDVNQYAGSLYGPNVTLDEVAIFKIKAFNGDALIGTYNNTYYDDNNVLQYNSPLCIEYADFDNMIDNYTFELWIYVTSGDNWDYVLFHTWNFTDDQMIPAGDDGVVDFVLGNCVSSYTDLLLPPWMNLPGSFDFKVLAGTETYIRTVLANIGDGYDIINGTFHGWCADKFNTIYTNTLYPNTQALSSLYPHLLPGTWPTKWEAIASANWIFNTYPPTDDPAVYTKEEIQDALWILFDTENGYVPTTANGVILAEAASSHTDYSPLPGGWAAVFYYVGSDGVQMTLTWLTHDVVFVTNKKRRARPVFFCLNLL